MALPFFKAVGSPSCLSCGSMLWGNCSSAPASSETLSSAVNPDLAKSDSAKLLNHSSTSSLDLFVKRSPTLPRRCCRKEDGSHQSQEHIILYCSIILHDCMDNDMYNVMYCGVTQIHDIYMYTLYGIHWADWESRVASSPGLSHVRVISKTWEWPGEEARSFICLPMLHKWLVCYL